MSLSQNDTTSNFSDSRRPPTDRKEQSQVVALLNQRIIEMDKENEHLQSQVQFKDKEIDSLKDTLKHLQTELDLKNPEGQSETHKLFNLDDVSQLEA